ncbi:MAG: pimeloyl-ACP methyl ester esterase BioH [Casimicrobiaceae bacterium]
MSDLHVEVFGHGPPLVLLHGWAMHGGLFASLIPALSRRFRVLVVDLPGHGNSAAAPLLSVDDAVQRIEAVCRDITEPLRVLGWSMGGALALHWARRAPDRIARLVLVSASPRFITAPDWPHAMAPATLQRFGDELAVAYRLTLQRFLTLQVQGSDGGRTALHALRDALFARGDPGRGQLRDALAMLQAIDVRGDLAHIGVPALLVAGDRDTLTPAAASAWMAATMSDARLVTIPGAAHAPFLSHRAAFDAAVLPFLEAAPRA